MDEPCEPLSAGIQLLLRTAVVEHAAAAGRRSYPPTLHLGVPGEDPVELSLDDVSSDPGLRTDVVAALRVRAGAAVVAAEHLVWLTRSGAVELQDADRDWSLAVRSAYGEAGVDAPLFVVVNRRGWRDPLGGRARTWARVRPRR